MRKLQKRKSVAFEIFLIKNLQLLYNVINVVPYIYYENRNSLR